MYHIKKYLKSFNINHQTELHRDKIEKLKDILYGKTQREIMNDYDTFININKIVFEESRRYPVYEANKLVSHAKGKLAKIIAQLSIDDLNSYCDIGCGWGHFPRAAVELGSIRNCGIDILKRDQWDVYMKEANGTLKYVSENICNCDISEEFQLITSFSAFEHFEDPYSMLEAMSKLVAKGGYLNIVFTPIYNSTDGMHMYRQIHVPWYHLIFSEEVQNRYYKENNLESNARINYFNKWSAFDFLVLFSNFNKLSLLSITPLFNCRHYWFANEFPNVLPQYSIEELLIDGFELVYKKI